MEKEKQDALTQEENLKKDKNYLQNQLDIDRRNSMSIKKQKDELLDKME